MDLQGLSRILSSEDLGRRPFRKQNSPQKHRNRKVDHSGNNGKTHFSLCFINVNEVRETAEVLRGLERKYKGVTSFRMESHIWASEENEICQKSIAILNMSLNQNLGREEKAEIGTQDSIEKEFLTV